MSDTYRIAKRMENKINILQPHIHLRLTESTSFQRICISVWKYIPVSVYKKNMPLQNICVSAHSEVEWKILHDWENRLRK